LSDRGFTYGSFCGGCGGSSRAITNTSKNCANCDGLILGHQNCLHYTGDGRGDFSVDLVGRDFHKGFVDGDRLPDLLQPPGDRSFGDAFAEGWEGYFLTHGDDVSL
jgi:hypothetical protein